ncbi:MAG: Asp-tRNA(Asn)/Glu-tRNA(Gln) amidotransferase subunit GatA [Candidatus Paceibacterota bacterium]|jgi:aspartyl-tRNA(Asn)/glutamyl-tRNA(Gln) amidotransferase subunit A
MIDLKSLTIKKAHESLLKKDFSAVELLSAYRENIEKRNKKLNAYLEVFDDATDQAKSVDVKIGRGDKISDLAGIPLAIKDIILYKGHLATAASKILAGHHAVYDSTVVTKLKNQDVVITGRTNMDEFAHGSSGEHSAYGPTLNPLDETRVPGGSSSGSGATVAADMALVSLGTDTGGSVRLPASYCGLVGLKPTYGAVSRYGIIAMGSSFDQVGPIGKTVGDAEILFNAIKGKDSLDSTTYDYNNVAVKNDKKKMRIGIPRAFVGPPAGEAGKGVEPDVIEKFNEAEKKLRELGHEIIDIDLPNIDKALAVYYILIPAEISANLARFDGVRFGLRADGKNGIEDYFKTRGAGFGAEARRRIMLGTYILSHGYYDAYYNKAVAVRQIIKQEFINVFKQVDAFITPTGISPAPKLGANANDPLAEYLLDIFTVSANVAQVCAMSVPMGTVKREDKDLPVGLHLTAPHFAESTLFTLGKQFLGEVV